MEGEEGGAGGSEAGREGREEGGKGIQTERIKLNYCSQLT